METHHKYTKTNINLVRIQKREENIKITQDLGIKIKRSKGKEIHELDGPATSSAAGWDSGSSSSGTPMGAFG
jgi:hypothetical protein